jgi:hypothetical protein
MKSRHDKHDAPLIRPVPALLALAAGLGLSGAIAFGNSTEVGQTTATPNFGVQTPVVAASTVPGTPSYETPDGVLTRWRFHSSADAAAGAVRLKIFRYTGTGLAYEVLAESSLKTLAPDTAYEFKERIPVKNGNLLGLTAVADAEVGITVPNTPGNQMAQFGGGDIAPGQTGTATIAWPNQRVSVAATVESDADNDGFGDDTQDGCPTDAARQDSCPADKRAPALVLRSSSNQDVLANRAVSVTVTSDENGTATGSGFLSTPGASRTFKLRSAGKAVRAGSRARLKLRVTRKALRAAKRSLRRGGPVRARVTVRVRDGAGNVATARKTVKVKRPKRR